MPLDPELVELMRRIDEAPPLSGMTPEQAREAFARMNEIARSVAPEAPVGSTEDVEVPGAAGPLRARIYRPDGDGPHPTLVFFHGGGFTLGDVDTHDLQTRILCREVEAVVLSSDYRLAPEHPFPAGVEDALSVARWAIGNVGELGGDPARLAVGGDSAGGNFAAVVAQQLRGSEPALAAQLLIYPSTDLVTEHASLEENATGYFLTLDDTHWFHANYLPEPEAGNHPLASPILAEDLSGLPPTVLATAELDPVRDAGDAYADALAAAGVPVIHRRVEGQVHGFFGLGPFSGSSRAAIEGLCADLRGLLAEVGAPSPAA
jgi:acetyl esterase